MKGFKVVIYISFSSPKLLGAIDATDASLSETEMLAVCHTASTWQLAVSGGGQLHLRGWRVAFPLSVVDSVADHASTRLSSNRLRDPGDSGGQRESE